MHLGFVFVPFVNIDHYSRDNPVLVVTSGDHVTLTCQRPCNTSGVWIVWEKSANYTVHELTDMFQDGTVEMIGGVTFAVHGLRSNCSSNNIISYTLNFVVHTSLNGFIIKCGIPKPASTLYYPKEILVLEVRPDVQVTSNQIDRHPTVYAKERGNVSITCEKTAGTISEWKFLIQQSDANPLELWYSKDLTQLEELGIKAKLLGPEKSSSTVETHDMQNFSILILNVQIKMTGIAIVCGAKESGAVDESQVKFYNQAAILIVHKGNVTTVNTVTLDVVLVIDNITIVIPLF